MLGISRLDDTGLTHLQPQVIAFTRALADSSKHRESAVLLSHVVDEFLNENGFAHAGAAKETDFSTLQEGLNEINDLDAGLKHFCRRRLVFKQRCWTMDGHGHRVRNGAELVDGLADHIHHASESATTHGHGDRSALVDAFHAAHHALGGFHGDAANAAFAQVLLDLHDDVDGERNGEPVAHNAKCLINRRHRGFGELHVHGGAGDLNHVSNVFWHIFSSFFCGKVTYYVWRRQRDVASYVSTVSPLPLLHSQSR